MSFIDTLLKSFKDGLKSIPEAGKSLLKLPVLFWLFLIALCRYKRKHDDCCTNEIPLPPDVYKRADPLIYDQYYLMKMGLAVTWDNPDIQLYRKGVPVSSSGLKPNENYDVVARVWNGSYDAPAMGLPVYLSYLSFGVGTTSTFVGKTFVDLGAKGTAKCPAYAKFVWRTPAEGHYCLQAVLVWPDDANPDNNLGQENTQVGVLHSPALFDFTVKNNRRGSRRFIYEIDDYTLPKPKDCTEQDDTANPTGRNGKTISRLQESKARWAKALSEQAYGRFSNLDGWNIKINPAREILTSLEEINVQVSIEPKSAAFTGEKAFNVHAFSVNEANEKTYEGGVTLTVKK